MDRSDRSQSVRVSVGLPKTAVKGGSKPTPPSVDTASAQQKQKPTEILRQTVTALSNLALFSLRSTSAFSSMSARSGIGLVASLVTLTTGRTAQTETNKPEAKGTTDPSHPDFKLENLSKEDLQKVKISSLVDLRSGVVSQNTIDFISKEENVAQLSYGQLQDLMDLAGASTSETPKEVFGLVTKAFIDRVTTESRHKDHPALVSISSESEEGTTQSAGLDTLRAGIDRFAEEVDLMLADSLTTVPKTSTAIKGEALKADVMAGAAEVEASKPVVAATVRPGLQGLGDAQKTVFALAATHQEAKLRLQDLTEMDNTKLHATDMTKLPIAVLNSFLSDTANIQRLAPIQLKLLINTQNGARVNEKGIPERHPLHRKIEQKNLEELLEFSGKLGTSPQVTKPTSVVAGTPPASTKPVENPIIQTLKQLEGMRKDGSIKTVDMTKVPRTILDEFLRSDGGAKSLSQDQIIDLVGLPGVSKEADRKLLKYLGDIKYTGPKFQPLSTPSSFRSEAPIVDIPKPPKEEFKFTGFDHDVFLERLQTGDPPFSPSEITQLLKDYSDPKNPINSGGGGLSNINLGRVLMMGSPADLNAFIEGNSVDRIYSDVALKLLDATLNPSSPLHEGLSPASMDKLITRLSDGISKIFRDDYIQNLDSRVNTTDLAQVPSAILNVYLGKINRMSIEKKLEVLEAQIPSDPPHPLHEKIDLIILKEYMNSIKDPAVLNRLLVKSPTLFNQATATQVNDLLSSLTFGRMKGPELKKILVANGRPSEPLYQKISEENIVKIQVKLAKDELFALETAEFHALDLTSISPRVISFYLKVHGSDKLSKEQMEGLLKENKLGETATAVLVKALQ